MAGKKYRFITFKEYETEAFAEYLERRAEKGWFLKTIHQNSILCFEKGEPKKLKYCVAVFPGSSELESADSVDAWQFREYCEEAGWKLQFGGTLWQIFYTEDEDLLPIETDPRIRIENQRKITFSWGKVLGQVLVIVLWLWIFFSLIKEPGIQFSSYEQIFLMVFYAIIILIMAGRLAGPALWYWRAERSLKKTGRLPVTTWKRVRNRNMAGGLFFISVFSIVIFSEGASGAVLAILLFFIFILFVLYCCKILDMVRETTDATRSGKTMIYIIATVVGAMALVFVILQLIMLFPDRNQEEMHYERLADFPVSFEELGGYTFEEGWSEKSQQTVLCLYQKEGGVRQDDEGIEQNLRVEYFKSPISWIINSTKKRYPVYRGNIWKVEEKESWTEGEVSVKRYHYSWNKIENLSEEEAYLEEDWPDRERDLYVISNENELLALEFSTRTERDVIEPAVRALGGE